MRRLSFAVAAARRDPRLLPEYIKLWAGARRIADGAGWNPPEDDVLSWQDATRLAAPGEELPPPGPSYKMAAEQEGSSGAEWSSMDSDGSLGESAYALVRALRPATVVETGVARGISSAFVLAALADNDFGELYSIDLPAPRMVTADLVGAAIPPELKVRWRYHWGSAKRLLPAVLAGAAPPRLVIHDSDHDSDHSYDHMRWEIETAWRALSDGDVILCHDADFHSGFADAAAAVGGRALFIREPGISGLTGMLLRT
jgi:predicted O-methyltransferase YrrM